MKSEDSTMLIHDISLPLTSALAPWPGDDPVSFTFASQRSEGSSVNVGTLSMSLHAGTHADAPFHFLDGGRTIDELPLAAFMGPAIVWDVSHRALIRCRDLDVVVGMPTARLLLKTGAWTDPTRFPDSIPVMAPDVPEFLHEHGVVLVGVDLPSVDPIHSKDLPNHHALAEHGIHILESLWLHDIAPGEYEMIALPLHVVGGDAAPVRAVLREYAPGTGGAIHPEPPQPGQRRHAVWRRS